MQELSKLLHGKRDFQTVPPSRFQCWVFPHSYAVTLKLADNINIHKTFSKVYRQLSGDRTCFIGPKFVNV